MENKDKIFKVKVLLETDCNACDAADQVAAHLSLLMETLLDGDEAEYCCYTTHNNSIGMIDIIPILKQLSARTAIEQSLIQWRRSAMDYGE